MAKAVEIHSPASASNAAGFRNRRYVHHPAPPPNAVTRFIRYAYGTEVPARPVHYYRRPSRQYWQRIWAVHWMSPVGLASITGVAGVLVCLGLGFYCFNTLVKKSIDVQASGARVDVLMQRRNDLTRNLEKAIVAERRHETAVFEDVSHQRFPGRAAPPESAPPAQAVPAPSLPVPSPLAPPLLPPALPAASLLPGLSLEKLLAIVEQYPQVRLSENLQSLIQALVEVERDIGETRKKLVDAMNVYLHEVHTFPSKFFAGMFGFRDVQFFQAGPEAGHLVPVQF